MVIEDQPLGTTALDLAANRNGETRRRERLDRSEGVGDPHVRGPAWATYQTSTEPRRCRRLLDKASEVSGRSRISTNVRERTCGAKGNRTLDLVIANDALYQLSYSPKGSGECSGRRCESAPEIDVSISGIRASRRPSRTLRVGGVGRGGTRSRTVRGTTVRTRTAARSTTWSRARNSVHAVVTTSRNSTLLRRRRTSDTDTGRHGLVREAVPCASGDAPVRRHHGCGRSAARPARSDEGRRYEHASWWRHGALPGGGAGGRVDRRRPGAGAATAPTDDRSCASAASMCSAVC